MKYTFFIVTLFLFSTIAQAQLTTLNNSTNHNTLQIPTTNTNNTVVSPSANFTYTTVLHGAIDTVWRYVYPSIQAFTYPSLFVSSDGSMYMPGDSPLGGALSKLNANGTIEWTIDRFDHKDPSIKYFNSFVRFSEQPNGDIISYGGEGTAFGGYVPYKIVFKPDGTILEEKSTRSMIDSLGSAGFSMPTFTNILPEETLYQLPLNSVTMNLPFYTMDLDLTIKKREFKVYTGMDDFAGPDIIPYKNGTFIIAVQGKSVKEPNYHISFKQYTTDFELLKETIIPTNGASKFVVTDNNSIMIASSITTDNSKPLHLRKIDENGKELWQKVVDGLKDIPLKVNGLYTTRDGGFVVAGETWPRKSDGSINYDSPGRMGFITKVSSDGELQWYYTSGREGLWNRIFCVAETSNGDFITVSNSGIAGKIIEEESKEIVRLRPKTSSINEAASELQSVNLSPNPTSTSFTISKTSSNCALRIVNSIGMDVKKWNADNIPQNVDVTDLPNGMYFVRFEQSGRITTLPLVVKH